MAKFKLFPPSGSLEKSRQMQFVLNGVKNENGIRIKIENITNSVDIGVIKVPADIHKKKDGYIYAEKGISSISGIINLNIPSHSSHAAITALISVENKTGEDVYVLSEMFPALYNIIEEEEEVKFDGSISFEPGFVGHNETGGVFVKHKKNDQVIISINDRHFNILTNEEGEGSVHFKGKDIIDKESLSMVQKFPLYIYESSDNFVGRKFIGSYIHCLPDDIKTSVDVDSRCSDPLYNAASWVPPEWCLLPLGDSVNIQVSPIAPETDIPSYGGDGCEDSSINFSVNDSADISFIQKTDSTMLSSGKALHSFISIDLSVINPEDTGYNIGRCNLVMEDSSLSVHVIAKERVSIDRYDTTDNLYITVSEELWDSTKTHEDNLYVLLFNENTGYASYKVVGRQHADPSGGRKAYYLELDKNGRLTPLYSWIFNVEAVVYVSTPNLTSPTKEIKKLPFILNEGNFATSAINISIASNKYGLLRGEQISANEEDIYFYVLAESVYQGKKQIFILTGIIDYHPDSSPRYTYKFIDDQWYRLTDKGNNKNPISYVDRKNNLHVLWISDRSGVEQIYYGVIGPSSISMGNSAISSILDKQAELFISKKPFAYTADDIYYLPVEVDPSASNPSKTFGVNFNNFSDGEGEISSDDTSPNSVNIEANPLIDSAWAITYLNKGTNFDWQEGEYSSLNYQISFDMNGVISQTSDLFDNDNRDTVIGRNNIDYLYDVWKTGFFINYNDSSGVPTYLYRANNKMRIGKQENIYDRFVPIVGSYRNWEVGSIIDFTADGRNVQHFVVGLMPEKIYFKATNIQSRIEYAEEHQISIDDSEGYVSSTIETIYTGKVKLVVLLSSEAKISEDPGQYKIVREFPYSLNLSTSHHLDISVNYTKLFNEDVEYWMAIDKYSGDSRFLCNLNILVDGKMSFAESFVTDNLMNTINPSDGPERQFSLVFGIPSGGNYKYDKDLFYASSIYENATVNLNYQDIQITTPTYKFNEDIITIPASIRENNLDSGDNYLESGNDTTSVDYRDAFSLISLKEKNHHDFLQVPITLEGINSSPNIDVGYDCDVHLAWQSNRDKYWNIYYSNSSDLGTSFRKEYLISNTTDNSLMPSIAVNKNGKRMIVWQEKKEGKYVIYAARSLNGYKGYNRGGWEDLYADAREVNTHTVVFDIKVSSTGIYNFTIKFYNDSEFTDLYYSVSTEEDIKEWKINGNNFTLEGELLSGGDSVRVEYYIGRNNYLLDRVLYCTISSSYVIT
jgi:hypothetical protein